MKQADTIIRTKIVAALNTVLDCPVRDMIARDDDSLPYVLISTQTSVNDALKAQFGTNNTVLIQVLGKQTNTVSRSTIEVISGQVLDALIPLSTADYIDLLPDFDVVQINLDSMNDDIINMADGIIMRKLIRIRILIREK